MILHGHGLVLWLCVFIHFSYCVSSFLEVSKEVTDPQAFVPPTFCDSVPLEPEGDSFFGVFLKQQHLS